MSNSSIWPIDRTLSGATPSGQSEPESDGNERVLCICQSPRTGASPSDYFVSYPGHSLERSYPSAEMHFAYSIAPADWAGVRWLFGFYGMSTRVGLWGWAEKGPYDDVISAVDNFLIMGSKTCNSDGRSVWTVRLTMLKNKPLLVTFHKSILVNLRTFQPTMVFSVEFS